MEVNHRKVSGMKQQEGKQAPPADQIPSRPFAEFLEQGPPGTMVLCPDLLDPPRAGYGFSCLKSPVLQLQCTSEQCNGLRLFEVVNSFPSITNDRQRGFVVYQCRNCTSTQKTYALLVVGGAHDEPEGIVYKIGELPPFGPPVPARAVSLVGADRELFLKNRRAENQGLGIGAFAYYRRVVESQKDRLLDEILRVARRSEADPEMIRQLEGARAEVQFKKAVDKTREAIPASLLIDGHNPMVLLHKALSERIHTGSDEECLESAASIRVVLYALAEKIGQALADETELKQAVQRLMKQEQE